MHDDNLTNDDLRYQAMLYAAGEMSQPLAEVFEARLSSDASAQEALISAVQLAGLLNGKTYVPDPSYRVSVRSTVFACRQRLLRRNARLLWLATGSAAAIA